MYPGMGYDPFLAKAIENFCEAMEKLPPVLYDKSVTKKLDDRAYIIRSLILRPFSEFGINYNALRKYRFDEMWTQSIAWQNSEDMSVRGIVIACNETNGVTQLTTALSHINEHEALAGCLVSANFPKKDIISLFNRGIPLFTGAGAPDIRFKLEFEVEKNSEEIEVIVTLFTPDFSDRTTYQSEIKAKIDQILELVVPELAVATKTVLPQFELEKKLVRTLMI